MVIWKHLNSCHFVTFKEQLANQNASSSRRAGRSNSKSVGLGLANPTACHAHCKDGWCPHIEEQLKKRRLHEKKRKVKSAKEKKSKKVNNC